MRAMALFRAEGACLLPVDADNVRCLIFAPKSLSTAG